jgi:hypothetical protein
MVFFFDLNGVRFSTWLGNLPDLLLSGDKKTEFPFVSGIPV